MHHDENANANAGAHGSSDKECFRQKAAKEQRGKEVEKIRK